ncbi:MAG: hypothetical protein MUF87_14135 [Anaerolineae bacterium]|jgi:tetratricopeptide (TPR) repeat protein|nr:hypothetical protein [Anaerolineae bacterium]
MVNYVDLWGWFHSPHLMNETVRYELTQLFDQGWRKIETSPEEALTTFEQCYQLAMFLGDPCWILFCGHWQTETLLFYLDRAEEALPMAVEWVVKAGQPHYERCPVRGRVYRSLLDAYVIIDAVGYEDKIRETIRYMEAELPLDYDTHCLLYARLASLELSLDKLSTAIQVTLKFLEISEKNVFQKMNANMKLAYYYYFQGAYDQAMLHAEELERLAIYNRRKGTLAASLAWQAFFNLYHGDALKAGTFYRRAVTQMAQLGTKPGAAYFDALCAYHTHQGELDQCLALRDQQLEIVLSTQHWLSLCECRLTRARLLGKMGLPFDQEIGQLRHDVLKLQRPEFILAKIPRIESGDYELPWVD